MWLQQLYLILKLQCYTNYCEQNRLSITSDSAVSERLSGAEIAVITLWRISVSAQGKSLVRDHSRIPSIILHVSS